MAQNIKQNLEAKQELQLKLTPSLIQTVEILQMPLQELIEHIEQEVTENPFLEIENPKYESIDTSVDADSSGGNIIDELEEPKVKGRFSSLDDEENLPFWEVIPDQDVQLIEKIKLQINLLNCDEKIKKIMEKVLEKIDLDGFLREPKDSLLQFLKEQLKVEVTEEELMKALEILRTKIEPKGIGSIDLKEYLISQLDPKLPHYQLICNIITNDLFVSKVVDVEQITAKYNCTKEEVVSALSVIEKLNLYPLFGFSNEANRRIKPDAEIYYVGNELVVAISNDYLPPLKVNHEYSKFLREKKAPQFLKGKYQAAKKLVKDVNLRKSFLLKILNVIAQEQQGFFENGIVGMKVLTLELIAQKTNLSKSTISRVISNKYVQTPRGLFSIKFFLASAPTRNTKVQYSKVAICDKIKEIIANEKKNAPYTDFQIKHMIERELNINLSRRTITKFRLEMNIPSASIRKYKYQTTQPGSSNTVE